MKIIDMHTHLWQGSYAEDKANLLQAMERYQIDRVFVSGLAHVGNPLPAMVEEVNREVFAFTQEHPECVSGYVYVSPEHANALDVMRRGIEDQGMVGVKLWVATFCDDPRVYPLVEQAIEYGVPILIHAFHKAVLQLPRETTGAQVANLARRYPEAKLIMAHLGGNCYHGMPAVRDYPNVWVDYSGSIFRGDELDYALELVGADRILYGSDMCGIYLVNLGQLLGADISEADREKIFYGNTERLFDRTFRPGKGCGA